EIQVRNALGQPVPNGQEGEVWARGPNVMLGYWRDHEASSAALVNGLLRTGDVGQLDSDGYLFLAGRGSGMIQTAAHRVYPGEVEEAIAELADIQEVAVVGTEDEILGQVVKAYVVASPGVTLDSVRIKAHCRQRLAQYKIPQQVEVVPSLPKTVTGKVRRFEL